MNKLRESLAEYAHDAWSSWMIYLFSRSLSDKNGNAIIPSSYVMRWKRQLGTRYNSLPESEKESDRDQADKIIAAGPDKFMKSIGTMIYSYGEELRSVCENGDYPDNRSSIHYTREAMGIWLDESGLSSEEIIECLEAANIQYRNKS